MIRLFISLAAFVSLVTTVLCLPLAWVMPKIEASEIDYVGTVWSGAITNIPGFGGINTRMSVLAALRGQPLLRFESRSPLVDFSGHATASRIATVEGAGRITNLAIMDGRFATLHGGYQFSVTDIRLSGGCAQAAGQLTTDVLARNQSLWQWQGPTLSGPVRCENGDVMLSLSGNEAGAQVKADIRMSLDGTYYLLASIITRDPRAGVVLPLYGFEALSGEYRLSETGRWM